MEGLIYPAILDVLFLICDCVSRRSPSRDAILIRSGDHGGSRTGWERPSRVTEGGKRGKSKMVDRNGAVGRAPTYGLYTSRNVGYRK